MKKIIRLTENDLANIVKRVISEQIVDPKNQANVASTTSVNKLPTTGGPKPVDLVPKGCLKDYTMDKSQKYYQKRGAKAWENRKIYPSGKWSISDEVGQTKGYGYGPDDSTVVWGTWKCSGDKILFDVPGTEVGKVISIANNDTTNPGNWKSIRGKVISKTPQPQFNSYEIKVKDDAGFGCARVMTDYLTPEGSGRFEYFNLEIEKC